MKLEQSELLKKLSSELLVLILNFVNCPKSICTFSLSCHYVFDFITNAFIEPLIMNSLLESLFFVNNVNVKQTNNNNVKQTNNWKREFIKHYALHHFHDKYLKNVPIYIAIENDGFCYNQEKSDLDQIDSVTCKNCYDSFIKIYSSGILKRERKLKSFIQSATFPIIISSASPNASIPQILINRNCHSDAVAIWPLDSINYGYLTAFDRNCFCWIHPSNPKNVLVTFLDNLLDNTTVTPHFILQHPDPISLVLSNERFL